MIIKTGNQHERMFDNFNDWMTYVYGCALESAYSKKMFNWNIELTD